MACRAGAVARCRGVLCPGFAKSLPRCSPSLRGERSAERRRGLRDPSSRCERPDTRAKRVWVPLRSGTRAFRRSTTVFVRPCLTTSGRRLPPGRYRRPVVQQAPCAQVIVPIERCPRRPGSSGRLSRTRRHTVPASAKQEPSGMAPLNKQDENIYRTEFKPVNPAPGGDGRERRDGGKMSARHSDGRMGRLETSAQNKTARNDLRS
jgi:hypothetical protein